MQTANRVSAHGGLMKNATLDLSYEDGGPGVAEVPEKTN